MEALSWRWIFLSVLTITFHFKHFLNKNIWQATFCYGLKQVDVTFAMTKI